MLEKIRDYFKENGTKPLAVDELEEVLNIEDAVEFKELIKALNELEENGELVRTRKNRFGLPEKMNLIRGRIQMHAKGFAFLIPEDPDQTDVYIHHSDLASAMNNDKVLVRLEKKDQDGNRQKGRSSVFWSVQLFRLLGHSKITAPLALLLQMTSGFLMIFSFRKT